MAYDSVPVKVLYQKNRSRNLCQNVEQGKKMYIDPDNHMKELDR